MNSAKLLVVLILASPALAFSAQLTSPGGGFHMDVAVGTKPRGDQALPIAARITPAGGGKSHEVQFQLIRNSAPSDQTLSEAFLWSADESAVAIQNAPSDDGYGYKVIPLKDQRTWKARDILGRDGQWVDNNRLVFRGDAGNDGYFIGIFNAQTGKTRIAHSNLSSFTSYEITQITPTAIHFREETRASNDDRCYSFNTNTGARTALQCPK